MIWGLHISRDLCLRMTELRQTETKPNSQALVQVQVNTKDALLSGNCHFLQRHVVGRYRREGRRSCSEAERSARVCVFLHRCK